MTAEREKETFKKIISSSSKCQKNPKLFPRAHVQTLLPSHMTVFREHPYIQKQKSLTSQLFQHVNKDSLIKTVFFLFALVLLKVRRSSL